MYGSIYEKSKYFKYLNKQSWDIRNRYITILIF